MGLFDMFTADPAKAWPQRGRFKPELDVGKRSLSGVALGASMEALRQLGRPSNKSPFKTQRFDYKESGCRFEAKDGRVAYFAACTRADMYDHLDGADLVLRAPSGARLTVSSRTQLQEINDLLGPPDRTDADDDEIVDFHTIDECSLEVEATPDGAVKRINLYENT